MKKALFKDCIKEIIKSFKRFLSILLIVLLGVGFFAGIKAASPDMRITLDKYFDDKNVMDFQVMSTLGLTKDDIEEIKKVEGVENVVGSYAADAVVSVGNEEVIVKIEGYNEEINQLEIQEGRLPENIDECVVEENFLLGTNHKIGDKIKVDPEEITDDEGNEKNLLKNSELTIVGTVKSPLYLSLERGNSKLGSGVIDYYMYINPQNINADIFTNAYITVNDAKKLQCYNDEYKDKVQEIKDKVEEISESRRDARYNELYESANSKLQDAKNEFNKQKTDGEKQIQEAEDKLNVGKKELEDGKKKLEQNKNTAYTQFSEAQNTINKAKNELNIKQQEFETKKVQAQEQIIEYENELSKLKVIQEQYNGLKSSLEAKQKEYNSLEQKLENTTDEDEKNIIKSEMEKINSEITQIKATIQVIDSELQSPGIQDINAPVTSIENALSNAITELDNAKKVLNDANEELKKQQETLDNTKKSTYKELDLAENKIKQSEEDIKKGEEELSKAKEEFDTKIADAEKELDKAEDEVNEIKKPDWYILDREQNTGYASYIQDTDRVANIAAVFPVVFFVVAALISLTSMTRMVEEERVQIGTLKALGYSKIQIASKYVIYAALATIVGGVIGLFIGFNILPKIIADMYAMMYEVPNVILEFNITYAMIGMVFAFICTVGATIYSCTKELMQKPAELMRPKSPKPGKRVFLEKIPFIWKRLNFSKKVTARNIFRYKKRFLMTIIGVGGCTALIIAGFGLRDAISTMIPSQYGKINLYEVNISLKEDYKNDDLSKINDFILENGQIENILNVNVESVKIDKNNNNQSIQLIVPENVDELKNFVSLQSRKNKKEKYKLDDNGIIISEKLSKLLDTKVGDEIKIKNADDKETIVTVSAIT